MNHIRVNEFHPSNIDTQVGVYLDYELHFRKGRKKEINIKLNSLVLFPRLDEGAECKSIRRKLPKSHLRRYH
jgi:hypothetical protein